MYGWCQGPAFLTRISGDSQADGWVVPDESWDTIISAWQQDIIKHHNHLKMPSKSLTECPT